MSLGTVTEEERMDGLAIHCPAGHVSLLLTFHEPELVRWPHLTEKGAGYSGQEHEIASEL